MTSAVWLVMMSKYTFIPREWASSMRAFSSVVGAQVGVDLGEVRDPVAVVAGRFVLRLDRLVLEAGRQPDGRGAQALDVVDLVQEPVEVAAVVEALFGADRSRRPSDRRPARRRRWRVFPLLNLSAITK